MKTNTTRSLILLALAAIFLAGSSGICFYAGVRTAVHRAGYVLGREEKTELSLTRPEFAALVWVGRHDFVYAGNVYDFCSLTLRDQKYIITCEKDGVESSLLNATKKQTENNTDPVSRIISKITLVFDQHSFRTTVSPEQLFTLTFCFPRNQGITELGYTSRVDSPPEA